MISAVLALLLGLSSEASAGAVQPVDAALEWARPFVLDAPDTYTMTADRTQYSEGLLLQLRVDPALLVPRQVDQPILYLGALPLFPFNADPVGGCLVAYVPLAEGSPARPAEASLSGQVLFSDTELPSRVHRSQALQLAEQAARLGAEPLQPAAVRAALAAGGPPLRAADLRDVHRAAMERVASCTSTPSDLQRPGIPPQPRP